MNDFTALPFSIEAGDQFCSSESIDALSSFIGSDELGTNDLRSARESRARLAESEFCRCRNADIPPHEALEETTLIYFWPFNRRRIGRGKASAALLRSFCQGRRVLMEVQSNMYSEKMYSPDTTNIQN